MGRIVVALAVLVALVLLGWGTLWFLGQGKLGENWDAGQVSDVQIPAEIVSQRARTQRVAARRLVGIGRRLDTINRRLDVLVA